MNKPELLAPAGNWINLRAAIDAGADAVYFGLKGVNMRANTENFSIPEIKKVIDLCHKNKVKAYLTINTIIYDNEITNIEKAIKSSKPDAIICWDHAVISLCKKYKIPIFLSTQASISNTEAAKFYKKQGVKRIIPARELKLVQLRKLTKVIDVETFIHGALCYSISGRCFFSQELYKRSANRGDCIQPCRRRYKLTDIETNKEIQVCNNKFISTKDLCTLPFLDKLIKAGICSFKIEGRNRSPEYVSTVTKVYREAIDSYYNKTFKKKVASLLKELEKVYNRKFSSGFYLAMPTANDITNIQNSAAKQKRLSLGKITNYLKKSKVAVILLTANDLSLGDTIIIEGKTTGYLTSKVDSMEIEYKKVKKAKKGKQVAIKINDLVRENDQVYLLKQ